MACSRRRHASIRSSRPSRTRCAHTASTSSVAHCAEAHSSHKDSRSSSDTEFWYTEPVAPDGHGLFRARYRLPAAFRNRLNRPRVALVDDVMSAGSSLRATHAEVHGVTDVAAVGTLLQLGAIGADYFKSIGLPVHAVAQQPFEMWAPADCPQCAAGVPIERVA